MAAIAGWLLCNGREIFVALPGWHLPSHPAPKSWRCTWRFAVTIAGMTAAPPKRPAGQWNG
jgi:hypothetical protein